MKRFALIAFLATAGLTQVALAGDWPDNCPEGTYPTPVGHCQPAWEFE